MRRQTGLLRQQGLRSTACRPQDWNDKKPP
jgi:hypothetical protein